MHDNADYVKVSARCSECGRVSRVDLTPFGPSLYAVCADLGSLAPDVQADLRRQADLDERADLEALDLWDRDREEQ